MANWDLIALLIFFVILIILFKVFRKKFDIEHKIFVMYRTKFGLKFMDKVAKCCPRFLKFLSYVGIVTGFAGMALIVVMLVKSTIDYILIPGTPLPIQPVLPGVAIQGLPTVSFFHWIIAILILATIHEISHGIIARLYNVKVKSSGFAFLGPIIAAFVEPDEKQMMKKKPKEQLGVLAAGPFSNIVAGFILLLVFIFLVAPIIPTITDPAGITVIELEAGYPMINTDIEVPFIIENVNGVEVVDIIGYMNVTKDVASGDIIVLDTDQGVYAVVAGENPINSSAGYLGIIIQQELEWKDGWKWAEPLYPVINWFTMLVFWLWIFNFGVGLFNLLPFTIVDGGRMFYVAAKSILKTEKRAVWAYKIASFFILLIIFILIWVWFTRKVTGFLGA